ncbi:MAG: transketolase [Chlorobiales bacterium]|nr:transketolase [Chlorobiales bacterium]
MTYEEKLYQLATENENIVVMTAENRAAIRGLPQKLGNRFIDVGIAEQTMVGAAAGLALRGRIPIIHALATFLTLRAFEFIRTDVGIANLPVKIVGGVPGFLSDGNGPTHQAIEDISLMRGIPNMQVFCPADEEDLVSGLPEIMKSPAPCYIRYNAMKPAVSHEKGFEIGKAEVLSTGNDIAILTYGFLLREAVEAKAVLESEGLSVRLVNLRMLKPIDEAAVLKAALETRLLVTLEDHFLTGGLFSIVAELLVQQPMKVNLLPFALKEKWFKPALLQDVLQHEGFTGKQIAERILAHVRDVKYSVL